MEVSRFLAKSRTARDYFKIDRLRNDLYGREFYTVNVKTIYLLIKKLSKIYINIYYNVYSLIHTNFSAFAVIGQNKDHRDCHVTFMCFCLMNEHDACFAFLMFFDTHQFHCNLCKTCSWVFETKHQWRYQLCRQVYSSYLLVELEGSNFFWLYSKLPNVRIMYLGSLN